MSVIVTSCKNNTSKDTATHAEVEAIAEPGINTAETTIGKWTSQEGQIASSVTLYFNKDDNTFYVHDEMRNPTMVLFDQIKPVKLTERESGVYEISYVQKWDDHYILKTATGTLFWYCKDFNDVKMTTKQWSSDALQRSFDLIVQK